MLAVARGIHGSSHGPAANGNIDADEYPHLRILATGSSTLAATRSRPSFAEWIDSYYARDILEAVPRPQSPRVPNAVPSPGAMERLGRLVAGTLSYKRSARCVAAPTRATHDST